MHPHLGGNKWFKLQRNIAAIQAAGSPLAVSFGGAYSNHLRALAAAGQEFGLATLGFVRGDAGTPLNPVLEFTRHCGMELRFLSRSDYRRRNDPAFVEELTADLGPVYVIPEGGNNALGVAGCESIVRFLDWEPTGRVRLVALACGTGATTAGIIRGLAASDQQVRVLGVSVLKAPGYLQREVSTWLEPAALFASPATPANSAGALIGSAPSSDWQILDDYHCGGYARISPILEETMASVSQATGLPLEPVYTGKLMLALVDQARRGLVPAGSELIMIHTGGLLPTA